MNNLFDFTEKKFIVTGASSGIGKSTAIQLSEQGARVILVGRNRERLEETLNLMKHREHHQIIDTDLGETEDMTWLFEESISDGVRLDGLVHCAGIATILPINRLKRNKLDECMSVNLYALLELIRVYAKKKYRNVSGSIVAVSSLAACSPSKCQTIYAASKAAVNAAVQALSIELAEKRIRINCVMPGSVDTRMLRESVSAISDEAMINMVKAPLLGLTKPDEIANMILFLLSDASSAVTGRAIYADGGMLGSI